jgi:ketosteroid isomerase-like protein
MSQENLALTRRAFDALNRHDWDGFLALMHQEVEAGSRQVAIEGGYHAHQGLRRWWTDLFEAFPDYTAQVQELRDLGDVTVARLHGRGHAAHGDAPVVDQFWVSSRWLDGRCVWWRSCSSEREALEAAGLRE